MKHRPNFQHESFLATKVLKKTIKYTLVTWFAGNFARCTWPLLQETFNIFICTVQSFMRCCLATPIIRPLLDKMPKAKIVSWTITQNARVFTGRDFKRSVWKATPVRNPHLEKDPYGRVPETTKTEFQVTKKWFTSAKPIRGERPDDKHLLKWTLIESAKRSKYFPFCQNLFSLTTKFYEPTSSHPV